MTAPTIQQRLQKRFVLMTANPSIVESVKRLVPADWEMRVTTDLESLGDWNVLLLYRFLILDLDEIQQFDPLDVMHVIRMEYQINLPVFCFGGDEMSREEMRLARADRFFNVADGLAILPEFFRQYSW